MLISDAPVRQHLGEPDAGLTLLAYFSRHPTRAHVSISGSVATYLYRHPFSRCLIRSKTWPIEKCSYRLSNACAADDDMTHSA